MSSMPSGLKWRKSSYSESGNCVEIASLPDGNLALRDSKDIKGPILLFTLGEWRAFLSGVKGGEFDS
jgi:Domain of unknown function (DUF397)